MTVHGIPQSASLFQRECGHQNTIFISTDKEIKDLQLLTRSNTQTLMCLINIRCTLVFTYLLYSGLNDIMFLLLLTF